MRLKILRLTRGRGLIFINSKTSGVTRNRDGHASIAGGLAPPWPPATELSPGDDDADEVYVRSHIRRLRRQRAVRCAAVLQRCVFSAW